MCVCVCVWEGGGGGGLSIIMSQTKYSTMVHAGHIVSANKFDGPIKN